MLLLPIGLGNSLRSVPWVSIIIVLICAFVTAKNLPQQEKKFEAFIKMEQEMRLQYFDDYIGLFKLACAQQEDIAHLCDQIEINDKNKESVERKKTITDKLAAITGHVAAKNDLLFDANIILSLSSTLVKTIEDRGSLSEEIKTSVHYEKTEEVEKEISILKSSITNELNYLSKDNLSISSLLNSTFTHINWIHFTLNCLILFLLGQAVEQVIGSLKYSLLFVIGSMTSLAMHALINIDTPVVGSSGGVFTILGFYYLLFINFRLNFLVIYIFFYKRFNLPIKWSLPVFIFSIDILSIAFNVKSTAAHHAHLAGALIGLGLAFIYKKNQTLGPDQIYPEEQELLEKINQAKSGEDLWANFSKILYLNCQNSTAFMTYLIRSENHPYIPSEKKKVIRFSDRLGEFLVNYTKDLSDEDTLVWLKMVPSWVSLKHCFKNFSVQIICSLADIFANLKNYKRAIELYRYAKKRKPQKKMMNNIDQTLRQIELITKENAYVTG